MSLQADKINWDTAGNLLPLLQHVVDTHRDSAVKETAADVRVLIATHGRVSFSGDSSAAQTNPSETTFDDTCAKEAQSDTGSTSKPLIEVISSTNDPRSSSPQSAFETAAKEAVDVHIPVRGHGLLALRRLVDSDDAEVLTSVDRLLTLCEKTVDDADSYVYLNAVQLLASLAAKFPQRTLPWLVDKYLAVGCACPADAESQQSVVAEKRMKLGEVLVKTSSALGMLLA